MMWCFLLALVYMSGGRGGLVVHASDSGSRGRGFECRSGQTVLCPSARHIYSPKVLVIPRKRWLCPNMTEKLFTGTLRINQPTFGKDLLTRLIVSCLDKIYVYFSHYRIEERMFWARIIPISAGCAFLLYPLAVILLTTKLS